MSSPIPPKVISGVNAIPTKPQYHLCFLAEIEKSILHGTWNVKRPQMEASHFLMSRLTAQL